MVFNSLTFAAFFAVVLAFYQLPIAWRTRKLALIVASYLFYMAWNPPFVLILWFSTVLDWFLARRVHAAQGSAARHWLYISLASNLGLLGFFKYGGFLLDNFVLLVRSIGIDYQPAAPSIVLPVGISFYTFQTLSYVLDVYKRRAAPWHSFRDYALYVTFFPQLVAGPIVRAGEFLPQCEAPRRVGSNELAWGLFLLSLGLFQKIVLADGIFAPVAEALFDASARPSASAAWAGTFAFAGQIFCDFSGYSTCAIGAATCLGFHLPQNFHFPYAARGFSDFWRRWHISLSSWLRDYLYISLGGNRVSPSRTYVNLMLTMLIGGLWHGASWTFVAWGGLHGAFLSIERFANERRWGELLPSPALRRGALAVLTFVAVSVAWVFFRSPDFQRAFVVLSAMFGAAGVAELRSLGERFDVPASYLALACVVGSHWLLRDRSLEQLLRGVPWWVPSLLFALMWTAIVLMPESDRAFIYFQF